MRKTIIALILVIPMMFVLIVFSSVKFASLGVEIAVNGIRILSDSAEDGVVCIDLAEERVHTVAAEVTPKNAAAQGYKLSTDDPAVVEVTAEGTLVPKAEGTARVTATSDDKGYTDSLDVIVTASNPYDASLSLTDDGGHELLEEAEGGYRAELPTGRYRYAVTVRPEGFAYELTSEDFVLFEEGKHELVLPFGGEATLKLHVPSGGRSVEKTAHLNVTAPSSRTGILVNGEADGTTVPLDTEAKSSSLYVQCGETPVFTSDRARGSVVSLGGGRYRIDVALDGAFSEGDKFDARISADGEEALVTFSFAAFSFRVSSDLPIRTEDGKKTTAVPVGGASRFYAVAAAEGSGATFEWTAEGAPADILKVENGGGICTVNAAAEGTFTLRVRAVREGAEIADPVEIQITAVQPVSALLIGGEANVDLAECFTVPGTVYNEGMERIAYRHPLNVSVFVPGKPLSSGGDEIVWSADPEAASIERDENGVCLVPKGAGKIAVSAEWRWNAAFGKNLRASLTLNILPSAVGVRNAPEYVKATGEKLEVVLLDNIKLGTDREGVPFTEAQLDGSLGRAKSTYNIEWYKTATDDREGGESNACFSYVSEIFNDVYGNGFSVDANNYTHAVDGNNNPLLENYRDPLYFVKYKQTASVAGQDNCAFLIRTAGVTLYGVTLLGCSDTSLISEGGGYDLSNLNHTGTVLEINASCNVVNCRVRNGRNVVRAYGGNADGSRYFVETIDPSATCDGERITVNIEGCILSHGREFILKTGANRALRANSAHAAEPRLTDKNGAPYPVNGTENYYGAYDEDFYSRYVLTDVTLKDSVLETSGLFTVGVESNFSGEFLWNGASDHTWREFTADWENSGGTSFAAVLHLKGDVRLYDWKDLELMDSGTLIESPVGALSEWLRLDIKKMIGCVYGEGGGNAELLDERDGKQYVHGGIAFYGGGRNYSRLDTSELKDAESLLRFHINIAVLADSDDETLQRQGTLLPQAAGTNDFNFFLYGKSGSHNYDAQLSAAASGTKYSAVAPATLPLA